MRKLLVIILLLTLSLSLVAAEYSLDIRFDKNEYAVGEEVVYTIVLLEDTKPISDQVAITFSDALEKKQIKETVTSNQKNKLLIEEDFISGGWKAHAIYKEKEVDRTFFIKQKTAVEFKIEGEELIITNKGNTHYQKQIQIIIGDDITPLSVTVGIGKTKRLKLVAPEGNYDIQIRGDQNEILATKKAVTLTGTGNVIGAYDESLLSGGIIGGTDDPDAEKFFSGNKLPLALVFVGAIFVIGILFFIQRRLSKKN